MCGIGELFYDLVGNGVGAGCFARGGSLAGSDVVASCEEDV